MKDTVLDVGLVEGYRGPLYPAPLYRLANGRTDGGLRFDCASKVEPIH